MQRLRELLIALLIAMLALFGVACDVGEGEDNGGGEIGEEEGEGEDD
jgi:hypothetical protein